MTVSHAAQPTLALKPAADAILLDSTHLSIEAVVERVMAEVRARRL